MKKKWLVAAMFAALFGMLCAGVSLHNYLRIHRGGAMAEGSFCSVNEFVDCDVVEASSYATFLGVPVATFGLVYYLYVLIVASLTRFARGFRKPSVAFAWWTSNLAVLYSIMLLYISLTVLRTICLTCIGMYFANIVMFVSLFFAMRVPLKEIPSFAWGYWMTVIKRKKVNIDFKPRFTSHVLASLLFMIIGVFVVTTATGEVKGVDPKILKEYVDSFYRQSKYDIKFDKNSAAVWGNKNAPIEIVEFSDYRCPYCRVAAFSIRPFLAEHRNDVAFYFINYPLDSTCNHYMQHQMHPGACLGAKAAICADKEGKFWGMHDELFRSEGTIDINLVKKLAKKVGLNEKKLFSCMDSSSTEDQLQDEIEAARRVYITATPSIFINNRLFKNWPKTELLREIVARELKNSKKQSS